eukprot:TRINITY_DN5031_c0_g1_i1.p1 TRINITY_DN5031_c0_g1~~TRINITY_DN5031_c0_g1_i1.p1  ORF type:complete len:232 (-),score=57.95 TRINITY_DN5031_c0_g1_i1:55-705(-)
MEGETAKTLTEEQAKELGAKAISELERLVSSDGWELTIEKLGVKVSQKVEGENPVSIIKGVGNIKTTPDTLYPLLSDPAKRGSWDTFFEGGELVKSFVVDELALAHMWTKSQMTVWSRDFAMLVTKKKLEDGGYIIAAVSIEDDSIPKNDNLYVRGTIFISGYLVKPISSDEVEITYIFQVDAAGWLPTSIANSVNTYQPLGIIGMRKILTGVVDP